MNMVTTILVQKAGRGFSLAVKPKGKARLNPCSQALLPFHPQRQMTLSMRPFGTYTIPSRSLLAWFLEQC